MSGAFKTQSMQTVVFNLKSGHRVVVKFHRYVTEPYIKAMARFQIYCWKSHRIKAEEALAALHVSGYSINHAGPWTEDVNDLAARCFYYLPRVEIPELTAHYVESLPCFDAMQ